MQETLLQDRFILPYLCDTLGYQEVKPNTVSNSLIIEEDLEAFVADDRAQRKALCRAAAQVRRRPQATAGRPHRPDPGAQRQQPQHGALSQRQQVGHAARRAAASLLHQRQRHPRRRPLPPEHLHRGAGIALRVQGQRPDNLRLPPRPLLLCQRHLPGLQRTQVQLHEAERGQERAQQGRQGLLRRRARLPRNLRPQRPAERHREGRRRGAICSRSSSAPSTSPPPMWARPTSSATWPTLSTRC